MYNKQIKTRKRRKQRGGNVDEEKLINFLNNLKAKMWRQTEADIDMSKIKNKVEEIHILIDKIKNNPKSNDQQLKKEIVKPITVDLEEILKHVRERNYSEYEQLKDIYQDLYTELYNAVKLDQDKGYGDDEEITEYTDKFIETHIKVIYKLLGIPDEDYIDEFA